MLFTTDATFDDGFAHNAALYYNVYYVIDTSSHQLVLKEQYEIVFGGGNEVSYRRLKDGKEEIISEKEYLKVYKEYTQKKRGGGADGYIRSIKPVTFGRLVPHCTACLHR